ncbi:MAG: ywqA [Bacillales bacterium]|jgi:SNF2 family DNA or RNA helicase|nr:ywqA [Bacillales bacterium]
MTKNNSFSIVFENLDDDGVALHAVGVNGEHFPTASWVPHAFMWHHESFFGSNIETFKVSGKEYILLSPYLAYTFLIEDACNSLFTVNFHIKDGMTITDALVLQSALDNREIIPDYESSTSALNWKLSERNGTDDKILIFFKSILEDCAKSHFPIKNELKVYVETFIRATKIADISVISKDDWYEIIGWNTSNSNYKIGLQLHEPIENEYDWSLNVVIRTANSESEWFVWNPYETTEVWAEDWNRIRRTVSHWATSFPKLSADDEVAPLKSKLTEEEAYEFLMVNAPVLISAGVEVFLPSWWETASRVTYALRASQQEHVNTRFNSLESFSSSLKNFDWSVAIGEKMFSEMDFERLLNEKQRFIKIGNEWIILDPETLKNVHKLLNEAKKKGISLRDIVEHQSGGGIVTKLPTNKLELQTDVELDTAWEDNLVALRNRDKVPKLPKPVFVHTDLRKYQQFGYEWLVYMRQIGLGAILADDMGLGKTVQAISYFSHIRSSVDVSNEPILLICPTSVLGNWESELERFAPSLKVYIHYGQNRERTNFSDAISGYDIVLTSYGHVSNDDELFKGVKWDCICIDEAQNIKNSTSKQSSVVRNLCGKHHIALTGTPMENRLSELWSIFDFVQKGYLGNLKQFTQSFIIPVEKDRNPAKITALKSVVHPFILRRTKKDEDIALDLPDKIEQKEICTLDVEQAALYEGLVRAGLSEVDKKSGIERKGLILVLLSKLKQICNHPMLYEKIRPSVGNFKLSPKLDRCTTIIGDIIDQGESCLIFTQYLRMAEIMQFHFKNVFGLEVPFFHGGLRKDERDRLVKRFQNREFPVMILSLKAGGTGLNLTAANHVIHYDRWWNPAVENQATDRVYRIGQEFFVHVHKLITKGTLEERIDKIIETKQELNDKIMHPEGLLTELSIEELEDLMKLK